MKQIRTPLLLMLSSHATETPAHALVLQAYMSRSCAGNIALQDKCCTTEGACFCLP